jgi:riboflavin kinase/FMN adenylyltransferase
MEVHILDFTEDVYEKSMIVTLRWFIRPWEAFTDMDVLKKQITKDIASVRNYLKAEF